MKTYWLYILGILIVALLFLYKGNIFSPQGESSMTKSYQNRSDADWQKALGADTEKYKVCRREGTEKAGSGKYDKFFEKGTYYCGCCGGDYPVYSSDAKFDSGTGWPSFWAPIDPSHVELVPEEHIKYRIFGARTEVRCARCGSHLGHVFDDGPKPTGKRYCMNSVTLSFSPEGVTPQAITPAELIKGKK